MNNKTAVVVAPQFGNRRRGADVLRAAQKKRDEAVSLARREEEERQKVFEKRRARSERVRNAQEAIETLIADGGKERRAQAREIAQNEVLCLLAETRSLSGQDRNWAAGKTLGLIGWQCMFMLPEAESAFKEVFGNNIPENLAEKLARLVDKQTRYIAKKNGVMRSGKTARDRQNGAHDRHEANLHTRAMTQSFSAHSHMTGGGKK